MSSQCHKYCIPRDLVPIQNWPRLFKARDVIESVSRSGLARCLRRYETVVNALHHTGGVAQAVLNAQGLAAYIELVPHCPARGAVYGCEQAAPFSLDRHLWQVLDGHVPEVWFIELEGLDGGVNLTSGLVCLGLKLAQIGTSSDAFRFKGRAGGDTPELFENVHPADAAACAQPPVTRSGT